MLNYETILSSYDDKLTLLEWLKKVEEALKNASATSFKVNKKGNATISFSIVFEDGSELESGDIVLQQGESVASAAIVNGHLELTLTNGDVLDAGNTGAVTGFSIDGSQHLVVTYQDGTTQDLGAIFQGNVNITGDLTALKLEQTMPNYETAADLASIVGLTIDNIYTKLKEINGRLDFIFNIAVKNETGAPVTTDNIARRTIAISSVIASKIIDFEGESVAQAKAAECVITSFKGLQVKKNGDILGEVNISINNNTTANQMIFRIFAPSSLTWAEDEVKYFTGRTQLDVI